MGLVNRVERSLPIRGRHAGGRTFSIAQFDAGESDKMWNAPLTRIASSGRAALILRTVLFLYVALIFCPIRYFALTGSLDNTWVFALNYAAARGLRMGHDIEFTAGPLAFLAVPQDIGSNLAAGLAFQVAIWALLIVILWQLFFRSDFSLVNLAFFSMLQGLAAPLYRISWYGAGDLLVTGVLVLLLRFRLRGSLGHYLAALGILGMVPLIQFAGVPIAAGIVMGLIADGTLERRPAALREIALAAAVPLVVTGVGYGLALRSVQGIATYLKSSLEISGAYSFAMSIPGTKFALLAALEALVLLVLALAFLAAHDRRIARFLGLILAGPLFVSFKHGFVRQDLHVSIFFGFVAVALSLVVIVTPLAERRALARSAVGLILFAILFQDNVASIAGGLVLRSVTGVEAASLVRHAIRFGHLRQALAAEAQKDLTPDMALEPEIKAVVGQEAVASLSMAYSGAAVEGLNLVIYPVIQRYSAYTPYLDEMNASWIREKGPRFLIFDGKSIDGRHPWTETPAMWVEVYRRYRTRLLGRHNLLLERQSEPRFTGFEPLSGSPLRFGDVLKMPVSPRPVFWTMNCSLTPAGKLRALLFRVREVMMTVNGTDGQSSEFRILPAVLQAPSLGSELPIDLAQFAAVFDPSDTPRATVESVVFHGPGASAYDPTCDVKFFQAVR